MDKHEKEYYIPVGKKKIYVDKEIFDEFNNLRRKQAYSNNKYRKHTISIFEEEEGMETKTIEDKVIDNLMLERLLYAVSKLEEEERHLIILLYFENFDLRTVAKKYKISHPALIKRRNKILSKLKKLINS